MSSIKMFKGPGSNRVPCHSMLTASATRARRLVMENFTRLSISTFLIRLLRDKQILIPIRAPVGICPLQKRPNFYISASLTTDTALRLKVPSALSASHSHHTLYRKDLRCTGALGEAGAARTPSSRKSAAVHAQDHSCLDASFGVVLSERCTA